MTASLSPSGRNSPDSPIEPLLTASGLSRSFGPTTALVDASLRHTELRVGQACVDDRVEELVQQAGPALGRWLRPPPWDSVVS